MPDKLLTAEGQQNITQSTNKTKKNSVKIFEKYKSKSIDSIYLPF